MRTPESESSKHAGQLRQKLVTAFARGPDAAGILQGVRHMRQGKPHVRIVLVPSPKNGGHRIACEGRLEAALAISLELDPRVRAFRAQPFALPGPNGRALVCDFAVERSDGTYCIVDVKPSGQLERPTVQERMRHAKALLAENGIPHRIVTEVELEAEPARQIRYQLRKAVTVETTRWQRDQLLAELRALGPQSLPNLRNHLRTLGLPLLHLERLAASEHVSFTTDAPWGPTTILGDRHDRTLTADAGWRSVRDIVVRL